MNKVMLIGRLGQDPDVRNTNSGASVANLSVATTERQKDKDGTWQSYTEWHKVVCFGKTADSAAKYLKKGKQLSVEGRLKTEKWTDEKGVERYTTKIYATDIEFLSPKDEGEAKEPQNPGQTYDSSFGPDDEVPF